MKDIAFQGQNCQSSADNHLPLWNLTSRSYYSIQLVTLNKIVWNMHQKKEMLLHAVTLLAKHNQVYAGIPEIQVCIFLVSTGNTSILK